MKIAFIVGSLFTASLFACVPMTFTCDNFAHFDSVLMRINCVDGAEEAVLSSELIPVTFTVTDFEPVPVEQTLEVVPVQKTKTKLVGIKAIKSKDLSFRNTVQRKSLKVRFDNDLSTVLMVWDTGTDAAHGFFVDVTKPYTYVNCKISD